MAKINRSSVLRKTTRQAGKKMSKALEMKAATAIAQERQNLLNAFEDHPVTQEIQGGPRGANMSMALGGYGNLFSFLGTFLGIF